MNQIFALIASVITGLSASDYESDNDRDEREEYEDTNKTDDKKEDDE